MKVIKIILTLLLLICTASSYAQYLKRNGQKIVDQDGQEIILRGMGLGGWMLQEPYMMEMSDLAIAQWQIRDKIKALIGEANTDQFYRAWHANHCTRRDIDSLAAWGFNSVRLPMHYNLFTLPIESEPVAGMQTWLTEGFALTDSLIKWCAANHMYVILDMHAAPGGQGKDYAICDGNPAKPSLWDSEANKQKLIALWKKLAERYVNEPWVGGYDIINEPNWSFTTGGNQNGCSENSNAPLRQLMMNITTAIRQVDSKHLIIIEGNCWGNNYGGIFPVWDNNMGVSFHKYWSFNDIGSIQSFINIRSQQNVPVWLGESGENSNAWFTDAITLVESNNIGWAWWPLKKIGSVVGPMTIKKTPEYQTLLDYWKSGGTAPSPVFANYTLLQMASNAKNENCLFHKDVTDAMFRQIHDSSTRPFRELHIPGTVQCTDYDLGRCGEAYFDTDIADYHVSSGTYTAWNTGYTYRNDGVDIEVSKDTHPNSNGFDVGWIAAKEWLQYTVNVDSSAVYDLQIRYACPPGAKIQLSTDETAITAVSQIATSGGYTTWSIVNFQNIVLYKGLQKIRLKFLNGGINVGFLKFTLAKSIHEVSFLAVAAETVKETELIAISLNKLIRDTIITINGFTCKVNGSPVQIQSVTINNQDHRQLILVTNQSLVQSDKILLSYSGGTITSTDGTLLEPFTDLPVLNNIPAYLSVPGKVEAEAFSVNNGFTFAACTDAGGGQYAGYTNAGDQLDYRIIVQKDGIYNLEFRFASLNTSGSMKIMQVDENDEVLNSVAVSVPVTGGWQTWQSAFTDMTLRKGKSTLRIKVLSDGFNLNWFKFVDKSQGLDERRFQNIKIYPNPANDELTIENPFSSDLPGFVKFRNCNGQLVREFGLKGNENICHIFVGDLPRGFYVVELGSAGITSRKKLIIR